MANTQELHYRPLHLREFSSQQESTARAQSQNVQGGGKGEFVAGYGSTQSYQSETPDAPPAEPEVPSFSEDELLDAQKEAKKLGYNKGYEEGKKEAESANARREENLSEAIGGLLTRLDEELAEQTAKATTQAEQLTSLVMAVARKMAGGALEQQPTAAIEPMLAECLTMLSGEPHITIYVAEDHKELLLERTKPMAAQHKAAIDVVGDASMEPGDCRVKWAGGEAGRNQQELWAEMEAIIARAIEKSNKPPTNS